MTTCTKCMSVFDKCDRNPSIYIQRAATTIIAWDHNKVE